MAVANGATPGSAEPSRRQLIALALALTATVLTGGAAIAGLTRSPAPAPATPSIQQVQPTTTAPATTQQVEPGG
jgi:hypothetical protein